MSIWGATADEAMPRIEKKLDEILSMLREQQELNNTLLQHPSVKQIIEDALYDGMYQDVEAARDEV